MIPVRLSLKNFLSYGEEVPPLDFTPLHVVCLSGDNGHGKSALLDAMTWAIWGEARKAAGDRKPDERLLRMGATDMAVEFEFDLEGDRYRILRQYRTGRGGKSALEFQIYSAESEGYHSLTQPNITATQRRIIDTLRMDYTTFINSVFIMQGRADEFTNRSARERKKILADILGLWRYDELMERARQNATTAEKAVADHDWHLQQIDEALEEQDACLQSISTLQTEIQDLSGQIEKIEQEVNDWQLKQAEHETARLQWAEWQKAFTDRQKEQKELEGQLDRQRKQMAVYQDALAERDTIEQAYQAYQTLVQEQETFNEKLQILRQLESQRAQLDREVNNARHEVESRQQVWMTRKESIERTVEETRALLDQDAVIGKGYQDLHRARQADENWDKKRLRYDELDQQLRARQDKLVQASTALQSELGGYKLRIKELKARTAMIDQHQSQANTFREKLDQLRQIEQRQQEITEHGRTLNSHIEVLKDKIKLFEKEDEDHHATLKVLRRGTDSHCPLCDAALDDRRRETIELNLGEHLHQHTVEIQKIHRGIKIADDEKKQLTILYKEQRPQISELQDVQQALVTAENAVQNARQDAQDLRACREQITALQTRLDTSAFAPDLRQQIEILQTEKHTLRYNPERHQVLKNKIRELQHFESDKVRLDEAQKRQEQATASLPEIHEKLTAYETQLADHSYAPKACAALKDIEQRIEALDYKESRHQDVQHRLRKIKDIADKKEQLDQAVHQYDTAKAALTEREMRVQTLQDELHRLSDRIKSFEENAKAVDGIDRQLKSLRENRQALQKDVDQANRRLGAEQQKADRLKTMAATRPEIKALRQQAAKDQQVYEKLTVAFSKDGIPALIIENAIPEIEEEANRILSQLTGNRTQITIEPLRNLKTGGTKETLDIHISDELGTRPYEMFSGGEAFRINFALRIALSKLLAHRAGTRLRSLIIDEGFGTQDSQGLEYLVEALQSIQDDFEKIIVVTHLERLKNAFPARIEVIKHPDIGSLYEVVT